MYQNDCHKQSLRRLCHLKRISHKYPTRYQTFDAFKEYLLNERPTITVTLLQTNYSLSIHHPRRYWATKKLNAGTVVKLENCEQIPFEFQAFVGPNIQLLRLHCDASVPDDPELVLDKKKLDIFCTLEPFEILSVRLRNLDEYVSYVPYPNGPQSMNLHIEDAVLPRNMRKWRGAVRAIGWMTLAQRRAAERVYAPGATGYYQAEEHWNDNLPQITIS